MNTEQIWTKADVAYVYENLLKTHQVFHKGICFFNIPPSGGNNLQQYIRPMVMQAAGAISQGLVRSIIESSITLTPCDSCRFLLDNSKDNGELIPTVSLYGSIFHDGTADEVLFALAHEIGHVVAGDISNVNTPLFGTPAYLEMEQRADLFAKNLLGKFVAQEFLDKLRVSLLDPRNQAAFKSQFGTPQEHLDKLIEIVTTRLYVIYHSN